MELMHKSSYTKTPQHRGYRVIKISLLLLLIFITQHTIAQKVAPVKNSPLTGIALPEDSKMDKRLLSVVGAQVLLDMEAKKAGATLKSTEVLSLPLLPENSFTIESLTATAKQSGWDVVPVNDEKEYYWLQQNGRYVLMYFHSRKKEIDLYFAESNQAVAGLMPAQQNTDVQMQNSSPQQNNPVTDQQTVNTIPDQQAQTQTVPVTATPAISSGFKFNSTNFDDGWTSTVQEDWVEVTKDNIKVLLHYPKEGTIFPADPDPLTTAAWNILVAPRYSNLKNYKTTYISSYDRPYIGMGYATENGSGREVFIVLFRQGGGWLEFVAPDKNSFIQYFKCDPEVIRWDSETNLMVPLAKMASYNKFAVGAEDLSGKWTSDFTGIQQLYNVYTGNSMGMHMHQSAQTFVFKEGNTYNWDILVVSGMAGNAKVANAKSAGKFSMANNWQVNFSDIEGKPKLYDAYFTCLKGARMLWLNDANFPGSGNFTGYGLAK